MIHFFFEEYSGQRRWWKNCSQFPNDCYQKEQDDEKPAASQERQRSIQATAAPSGVLRSSWRFSGSWSGAPQPIHSYRLCRDHFLVQPSVFKHPIKVVLEEVGISCKVVQGLVQHAEKMWNDQTECK